jgi:acetylserotonin N-methyltransferase
MTNAEPTNQPGTDARIVLDLLDGFRASKAAFTAVSLGIFDLLHERPLTLSQLTQQLNANGSAIERLLGACVALHLLSLTDGVYRNEPPAERYLRVESPETLSGYVLYSDRVLYPLWGCLGNAVKEGTNRWEQVFDGKANLFDHFFAIDDEKRTFLAGMHGAGMLSSPAAVAAFDLGRFRQMLDLGGGTGHLVMEACRQHYNLQGVIFDLPSIKTVAEEYVHAAHLSDRIEVIAGDFFADPLPPADLYALGRIIHDWSEHKVVPLLEKINESLPDGGALLICEKLLNDKRDGPATAYLQSLNMLVCTDGRERTAVEYESLVKSAGFRELQVHRTGQPVDAMLALK